MSENDIYNVLKMLADRKITLEQANKLIDMIINYKLIKKRTS